MDTTPTEMPDNTAPIPLTGTHRIAQATPLYYGNPKLKPGMRYGLRRGGQWVVNVHATPIVLGPASQCRLFGGAYLNNTLWSYAREQWEPIPEGVVRDEIKREARESQKAQRAALATQELAASVAQSVAKPKAPAKTKPKAKSHGRKA
jgi:hypothetical protein